jgi:magnesium-transporting ATPase (P-type)
MGNLQVDWLLISSILGIITFIATSMAVFVWLVLYRPEILRAKEKDHAATTLEWKIIGEIMIQCGSLSGGIILMLNVLIFMLTGVWNIDARSLGALVLSFGLMLFKSFDSFVTGLRQRHVEKK